MYSILFSFLKPQIAFGGDSGGGGGSSSGGGGGSRADKKGAAAVLSAPKPVYTPPPPTVVNTSRDRSDRKGAAAVMSAPRPAPVVSAATRAAEDNNRSIFDQLKNIQLVSKDRPELEFAGADGPEPSELRALSRPVVPKTSPTPKLRPKNLEAIGQVTDTGQYAGDGFEWKISDYGEDDRPVYTRIYTGEANTFNDLGEGVISASSYKFKDNDLVNKIGDISIREGSGYASTKGSATDGDFLEFLKTGGDAGESDSYAAQIGKKDYEPTIDFMNPGGAMSLGATGPRVLGTETVLSPAPKFGGIDLPAGSPEAASFYGMSGAGTPPTAAEVAEIERTTGKSVSAMSPEELTKAIEDLRAYAKENQITGLKSFIPGAGIAEMLGDIELNRAADQLAGTYEPSMFAKLLGYGNDKIASYEPVLGEDGQIIGSLALDAAGNPIQYSGQRTSNPILNNPDIDIDAARLKTRQQPVSTPSRSDGSERDRPTTPVTPPATTDPTCPDGYTFDSEENACVLDPFQDPFPDAPTTGGGTYNAPPLSAYTNVSPIGLPTLMPGQQQPYMVPTPNVQPITVAAQTPVGLASLRRS
jgi:hypothetical protein